MSVKDQSTRTTELNGELILQTAFFPLKYFHFNENFVALVFNQFFFLPNYSQNREKLTVKFTVTLGETIQMLLVNLSLNTLVLPNSISLFIQLDDENNFFKALICGDNTGKKISIYLPPLDHWYISVAPSLLKIGIFLQELIT